ALTTPISGRGGEQFLVEGSNVRYETLLAKASLYVLSTRRGDAVPQRGCGDECCQRFCESPRVSRRSEQTGQLMFDDEANATDVGRHDRSSAGEGLDQRHGSPLVAAGESHHIEVAHGRRHVVPPSREVNSLGHVELTCSRLELHSL